jgi:hypothetical protein
VIDYRAMLGHGQKPVPTASPSENSAPAYPRVLEDSLGQLKRLYEQGLITEDDYRAKKQQLLDRL